MLSFFAKLFSKLFHREPEIITEGQESEQFWEDIGGRELYASGKILEASNRKWPEALLIEACYKNFIKILKI